VEKKQKKQKGEKKDRLVICMTANFQEGII
jgi:hypothetical protein